MKKRLLGLAVVVMAGCDGVTISFDAAFARRDIITLRLVNETEFPVDPAVFVSDLEDFIIRGVTESLLTTDENEQNFGILEVGDTLIAEYDCDDFKAVMAQDAELFVAPGISPEDSTRLLVDDDDFDCGDEVTIRYSGGILDFDARIEVGFAGF